MSAETEAAIRKLAERWLEISKRNSFRRGGGRVAKAQRICAKNLLAILERGQA